MLNTLQAMQNQQMVNNASSGLQQIKSMMNAIQNSQNPQGMFNSMLASNPKIKQAQDLINQYGGDGRAAFYAAARQKGMTDQQIAEFLNTLQQ